MWQTDTAEARAIADRLPQSACRGVLERIVRSVPIENRAHLAPLVMRFRKIAREVPWLFAELRCDQAALTTALDAILPTGWSAPLPNWRGVSQDLPVLSALLGRGQPIGEVEVLRAFLLVALAEGAVLDRRLGKSHVEVLAQTIRAIESTTNHRYRRALFWLCETRSAAEASQLLSERLKGQKGELAEIWPSVWHPYFLRRGTAPVRRSVATPSRRRLHVRLPRQVIPPVVHPITPPQPHEPPEEYNPISSLIYVRVRARNESARAHRLTELHRSRLANHALLAQHADVIAQDEWAEILPSLLGQLQREASPNILAEICVILLIAATGREPERLITLPIHDAPPHPEPAEACLVATQEAFLWQPIPTLQDQFHPGPSLRHRFETQ